MCGTGKINGSGKISQDEKKKTSKNKVEVKVIKKNIQISVMSESKADLGLKKRRCLIGVI